MKKLPPWAWVAGAVGVGAAFYIYKKSKEAQKLQEEKETESSSTAPYSETQEPPEMPYGVGGLGGYGGGGAGAVGNAVESQQELRELFGAQSEFDKGFSQQEHEFQESLMNLIRQNQASGTGTTGTISQGSGGGAPASPVGGQSSVAAPPTAAPSCPAAFPLYNPADGAVGPHSCYKYSRERCPNKAFPYKHIYQDGHNVCSPT